MKKQETLKLNIDLPVTSSKSHPNINLDSIPKKRGGKSLTVKCSNGADVQITEYEGRVYITINEHELEYDELVTLDSYKERYVSKDESHRDESYSTKAVEASTKTTFVSFVTFEK
mgnify:CR=1 FL=1|tara:strand:+ start:191 stop:535 length:345 start_codon:yes stop_codon:yes gene_type:complete